MSAIAPIIQGAGAVFGLLNSINSSRQASDSLNEANTAAQAANLREQESFDATQAWQKQAQAMFNNLSNQGYYDPQARLKMQEQAVNQQYSDAMGGTAAAMRAAGYKPGDSTTVDNLQQVQNKYSTDWANIAGQTMTQVPEQQMQDWGLSQPGLSASQGFGQAQAAHSAAIQAQVFPQQYNAQGGNPTAWLASMQPYLASMQGTSTPAGIQTPQSQGQQSESTYPNMDPTGGYF